MEQYLHTICAEDFKNNSSTVVKKAIEYLESGQIIFLPDKVFALNTDELPLLNSSVLDKKYKNISYNRLKQQLSGVQSPQLSQLIQSLMHRFSDFSKQLIDTLLPQYSELVQWGRTSYRPAEIKDRASSKRRDDTRVHVDSFSATPVKGLRILRVFCNINPLEQSRNWHVGESFTDVLQRFHPKIKPYSPVLAKLLHMIHVTKTLRTPYDHYMLNLHDKMKLDDDYQQNLNKHRIDFPAQSSWIVFTDHVSHAALSGQFLLEQTFYLPVTAMVNPAHSPLKILQAVNLIP